MGKIFLSRSYEQPREKKKSIPNIRLIFIISLIPSQYYGDKEINLRRLVIFFIQKFQQFGAFS